jgi:glycopeptide antibiotics resistance protein
MLVVTIEEISQLWFKSRTFSFADLTFDYAGIVAGASLATFLRNRHSVKAQIVN